MSKTTTVRERPILFRGDMVRAIIEGRKTQTRRIAKFEAREQGLNFGFSGLEAGPYANDLERTGFVLRSRDGRGTWNDRTHPLHCPYGLAGDRLWVRETWAEYEKQSEDERVPRGGKPVNPFVKIIYRADYAKDPRQYGGDWRPSIFMPRENCRLVLEVTRVRVERLQDMSHMDWRADFAPTGAEIEKALETFRGDVNRRAMTKARWDSMHGAGAYDANPWLWVVEFKQVGGCGR